MHQFRTNKRLRLEVAVLTKERDELSNRCTQLLGRWLAPPAAPGLEKLGEYWRCAEQMGKIEVDLDRDYSRNEYFYLVKIKFQTKKESDITAKGKGAMITEAFENAINEARALQAGVAFADA